MGFYTPVSHAGPKISNFFLGTLVSFASPQRAELNGIILVAQFAQTKKPNRKYCKILQNRRENFVHKRCSEKIIFGRNEFSSPGLVERYHSWPKLKKSVRGGLKNYFSKNLVSFASSQRAELNSTFRVA